MKTPFSSVRKQFQGATVVATREGNMTGRHRSGFFRGAFTSFLDQRQKKKNSELSHFSFHSTLRNTTHVL